MKLINLKNSHHLFCSTNSGYPLSFRHLHSFPKYEHSFERHWTKQNPKFSLFRVELQLELPRLHSLNNFKTKNAHQAIEGFPKTNSTKTLDKSISEKFEKTGRLCILRPLSDDRSLRDKEQDLTTESLTTLSQALKLLFSSFFR